jgi:broad specificity phosphatase PhoE
MDELLSWLRLQKGGVGTHAEFRERALGLRTREPQHAAAARLLADLAGRLADAYDEERFPTDMAQHALARLTALVQKVVHANSAGAAAQLAVLNEIGVAELV